MKTGAAVEVWRSKRANQGLFAALRSVRVIVSTVAGFLNGNDMSAASQAFVHREIMDIKTAATYLGVSRSHLSHILAGKVPGVPAIPHVRAGRRALIRRTVIDQWISEQEQSPASRGMAQ